MEGDHGKVTFQIQWSRTPAKRPFNPVHNQTQALETVSNLPEGLISRSRFMAGAPCPCGGMFPEFSEARMLLLPWRKGTLFHGTLAKQGSLQSVSEEHLRHQVKRKPMDCVQGMNPQDSNDGLLKRKGAGQNQGCHWIMVASAMIRPSGRSQ